MVHFFVSLSFPSKWGSSNGRPIQVSSTETFHELKIKVLTKMNILKESSNYVIAIFYESHAKGGRFCMKPITVPNENQVIIEKILLEESNWYSTVKLVLLDYRLRKSWKNMINFIEAPHRLTMTTETAKSIVSLDTIDNMINNSTMIYDIDRARNNDDLFFPDAMQQSLSNTALKQGTLKRKVIENYTGKEVWKEMIVFLCENRLWFRSQRAIDDVGEISFIELLTSTTAFVRTDLGSCDFMIVNYDDGHYSSIFRAKNSNDATQWVRAIIERKTLQSDNDAIITAETFISSNEETVASNELGDLLRLVDFENIISNNYMRSKYKSFLTAKGCDEHFKLWERCEDFCRGHPQSLQKFKNDLSSEPSTFNEGEVNAIANGIYKCFLKQESLRADNVIASSDLFKLKDKINQELSKGIISASASTFRDVQDTVFSTLRKKYYLEFLSADKAQKIIQSAIYANSRRGDTIMTKCVEPPAPENPKSVFRIVRRISAKPDNLAKPDNSKSENDLIADLKTTEWRCLEGLEPASVPWLPDEWWAQLRNHIGGEKKQLMIKSSWLFESYDVAMDTLHLQLKPYYDQRDQEDKILAQIKLEFRPFSLELTNNPHLKRRLSLGAVSSTIQKYAQPCTVNANYTSRGVVVYFGVIHCRYYDRYMHRSSELSETDNKAAEDNQNWNYNYGVLMECYGQGQLLLYDPLTFVLHSIIHLNSVVEISPSTLAYSGIDIKDSSGLIWRMIPVGVDSYDSSISLQRWLSYLRLYSSPQSKHANILKSGSLSKRGKINTNYRRRFFVMFSNHFFRYFKDSAIGTVCKGCIDFRSVRSVEHGETGGLGWISPKKVLEKEIVLKTSTRTWALRADTIEEANEWYELFNIILEKSRDDNVNPSIVSSSAASARIIDDDDDSD